MANGLQPELSTGNEHFNKIKLLILEIENEIEKAMFFVNQKRGRALRLFGHFLSLKVQ